MRTMGLALRQRERRNTATNINKENPNGGSTRRRGFRDWYQAVIRLKDDVERWG